MLYKVDSPRLKLGFSFKREWFPEKKMVIRGFEMND